MYRFALLALAPLTIAALLLAAPGDEPAIATQAPTEPMAINVKDFGAVGDGIADDTEAVQRAIDATAWTKRRDPKAVTATKVVFPPGHYRITESLLLSSPKKGHNRIVLEGSGGVDTFGAGPLSGKNRMPRAVSQLVWDGPEGGNLVDIWGLGGLIVRDLGLIGSDKAGVLLRVNSPRGSGGGRYTFYNVVFADAKTGVETGSDTTINSADMTLYDCLFHALDIGFHTRTDQNVDYAFIRNHLRNCKTGFYFEKGGNVYAALPTFIKCRLGIRIDRGGTNVGGFAFDGLHIEQGPYTILDCNGSASVFISGMSPQNQRRSREGGYTGPLFELSDGANVVVIGSNITNHPIAHIEAERSTAFLQMTNCKFGGIPGMSSDPRLEGNIVVKGEKAGFEVKNSFVAGGFLKEYGKYPPEPKAVK